MIRPLSILLILLITSSSASASGRDYKKLYAAGIIQNKTGNYTEAIRLYSEAIEIKSDLPELYFVRGRAYKQNDQLESAYRDFSEAIKLNPSYTEALNMRGVTCIGLNRLKDAKSDLIKACDLGNKNACKNLVKFKDLIK